MEIAQYSREYRAKTDDELLHLSLESDQLVPEAREQLRQEILARGISSKDRKKDWAVVESSAARERSGLERVSSLFPSLRRVAGKLNEWREFQRLTGEWPTLSILFYLAHGILLVGSMGFLVWFGVSHGWSKMKFILIFMPLLLVDVIAESWIEGKIRLKELREYRRRRTR